MRSSTLNNCTASAIYREIGSKYDLVKFVAEHMAAIEEVANDDIDALIAALNEAKDFTGITVVGGAVPNWDAVNKVLTVPTIKGDKGNKGDKGEVGPQGPQGPQGLQGPQGIRGAPGINGTNGINGRNGLNGKTPILELVYYSNTGMAEVQVVGYEDGNSPTYTEW